MPKSALTEAERELLEPFEYLACCWYLDDAKTRGQIPPTWLAASDEVRENARAHLLKLMARGGPVDPLARTMLCGQLVEHLRSDRRLWASYRAWVQAETDFKAMRDTNPRAFFAEYQR